MPKESLFVIWRLGSLLATPVMRSFSLRVVMVTSSSFRQMHKVATSLLLTAPTNVVPVWQIPVTLKFTRRAFPSTATSNRSSHSCLSHFGMTVVSGPRRTQRSRLRSAMAKLTQILWPKTTEITFLSASILASAILHRGTFPLEQRKKPVTKVAASPALVSVYSSISAMRLSVTVRTRSKSATAISLICISASRVTILTRRQ